MQTMEINKPKGKRKVRFPGICEDAQELGVTRVHLWMVLTGDRKSKRLMQRYRDLKAKQKGDSK